MWELNRDGTKNARQGATAIIILETFIKPILLRARTRVNTPVITNKLTEPKPFPVTNKAKKDSKANAKRMREI